MNTIGDFLNKLSRVNFINADSTSLSGEIYVDDLSRAEVVVKIETKIATSRYDFPNMPVQATVRVFINGTYANCWGCISQHELVELVEWFQLKKKDAVAKSYELSKKKEKLATDIYVMI
jgi:hypothetical protein